MTGTSGSLSAVRLRHKLRKDAAMIQQRYSISRMLRLLPSKWRMRESLSTLGIHLVRVHPYIIHQHL